MSWTPISREELDQLIDTSAPQMDFLVRRLWMLIRICPQKWQLEPWGNEGGGFWAVAIFGNHVVWYNDIEEGFNVSSYAKFGSISEYRCNQDQLHWTMHFLKNAIECRDAIPFYGLPQEV